MNKIALKEDERIDDLQNGYEIIQNKKKFCFGMDAVLLSDFAKIKKTDKVIDLCTGTGIIPILLYSKNKGNEIFGMEIQEECCEMAQRSLLLNNIQDKIKIYNKDIKEALDIFPKASFNAITCNPPYMIDSHGLTNENKGIAIARHEIACTLEDVIRVSSELLKINGKLFMVHRPFRLPEIMSTLIKYKLEPKTMKLVYPYVNKEPNMVLIEAMKGAKPRLKVLEPLIVYEENGNYTKRILEIYGKQ